MAAYSVFEDNISVGDHGSLDFLAKAWFETSDGIPSAKYTECCPFFNTKIWIIIMLGNPVPFNEDHHLQ